MPYSKKLIVIVSLLLMLLAANVYTLLFTEALFDGIQSRIWYLFVTTMWYAVGILLFELRTFFIVSGIAQMLVLPIEISSLYLNGEPVSMPFMYWIISTNRIEASELLLSVWWLVLTVIVVWCLYGWLVSLVPKGIKFAGGKRKMVSGLVLLMAVSVASMHYTYLNKTYTAPNKQVYARIYAWSLGMRVGEVFPYDIYLQTYRAFKHQKEIHGIASLSDYTFGISPRPEKDTAIYVFVIGEAARYSNFSINGEYEHETNPLLSHQPNLVSFTHAYSQANATDLSVPLMLTRATADNTMVAYQEKTVLGAFQEAGFQVAWLSAESSPIRYLQYVFPSIDTVWITPKESAMDEVLFSPYRELIRQQLQSPKKRLLVLHTKGSHLSYQDRYPESFDVFQPCLSRGTHSDTFDKKLMTNTYDNSILYTDFILHTLIQVLDSTEQSACLIYMPDHGENLCDDDRKLWVHGSYEGSQWEYHVPLLVWYSDQYKKQNQERIAALYSNKDKQVTSQVLFHSMCDMAGINEVVDARYSIFSDSLEEDTSLLVLNGKGEVIPVSIGK